MSPQQIKKYAAAKIVTAEIYDKEGYPVDGGLMDTRLGVIDPGLRCKTCSGKLKECIGHFGYIDLARPVIHIKYLKAVQIFLQHTCNPNSPGLYAIAPCHPASPADPGHLPVSGPGQDIPFCLKKALSERVFLPLHH